MLSRLCRSLTRAPRPDFDIKTLQDSLERNLHTINDDSNYTKERILRVIRSYYFLYSDSAKLRERKVWGREQMIQDSIRKLAPFINQLEPDGVNLLIVNLGLLNVYNPSVWREIETQFVEISHKYLPTSNIVKVIDSFQVARRKNQEVWGIINDKLLSEVYAAGQLEGPEAARTLRNLALVKEGSEELISKLEANVISTVETLGLRDLFFLLEGLAAQSNRNEELVKLAVNRIIELISRTSVPAYANILIYVSKTENFEMIAKLETLILKQLDSENISNLSKVALNYGKEPFVGNEDRRKFIETVTKYFDENKERIGEGFRDKSVFAVVEMKFIYPRLIAKIPLNDDDVLRVFKETADLTKLSPLTQLVRAELETYLKNKNLI